MRLVVAFFGAVLLVGCSSFNDVSSAEIGRNAREASSLAAEMSVFCKQLKSGRLRLKFVVVNEDELSRRAMKLHEKLAGKTASTSAKQDLATLQDQVEALAKISAQLKQSKDDVNDAEPIGDKAENIMKILSPMGQRL
jgi:hypothetical protein